MSKPKNLKVNVKHGGGFYKTVTYEPGDIEERIQNAIEGCLEKFKIPKYLILGPKSYGNLCALVQDYPTHYEGLEIIVHGSSQAPTSYERRTPDEWVRVAPETTKNSLVG